jgi:aarF domain-containing kinase
MSAEKKSPEVLPQQLGEEMNEISAYAQEYLLEITNVLSKVPRPLLLLFKTNDCLRSIDSTLKTPINSFILTSRFCTLAIQRDRMMRYPGIRTKIKNMLETANMEYRLFLFSLLKSVQSILKKWLGWILIQ